MKKSIDKLINNMKNDKISTLDLDIVNDLKNFLEKKDSDINGKFYILDQIKVFHNITKQPYCFQTELIYSCDLDLLVKYFEKDNYKLIIKNELHNHLFNDFLSNEKKYKITVALISSIKEDKKQNLKEYKYNLYSKLLNYVFSLSLDIKEYKTILKTIDLGYFDWLVDNELSTPLFYKKNEYVKTITRILNLYKKSDPLYRRIKKSLIELDIKENVVVELKNEDLIQLISYLKIFACDNNILKSICVKINKKYIFNDEYKESFYFHSEEIRFKYMRMIRLTLLRLRDVNKPKYIKKAYNLDKNEYILNRLKNVYFLELNKFLKEQAFLNIINATNDFIALRGIKHYYKNGMQKHDYIVLKRFQKIINSINKNKNKKRTFKLLNKINEFRRNYFESAILINGIKRLDEKILLEFFKEKIIENPDFEEKIIHSILYNSLNEDTKIEVLKNIQFNKILNFLILSSDIKSNKREILLNGINEKELKSEILYEMNVILNKETIDDTNNRKLFIFKDCYNKTMEGYKNSILDIEQTNDEENQLIKIYLKKMYFDYINYFDFKIHKLDFLFKKIHNVYLYEKNEIIDLKELLTYENIDELEDIFDFLDSYLNEHKKTLLKFKVNNQENNNIFDKDLLEKVLTFNDIYFIFKFLKYNQEKIENELKKID